MRSNREEENMKADVQRRRRMLEAKWVELTSAHRQTEEIAIQTVPGSLEELNLELQQKMAVHSPNRRVALLCQAREALKRIAVLKPL